MADKTQPKESPRARFVRLANKRGNAVLRSIDVLSKLATPDYEYGPEDVSALFAALRERIDAAEARFNQPTRTAKVEATLVK